MSTAHHKSPKDTDARVAAGLATDLGAYAIMLGDTNGVHLTSFSRNDMLSHRPGCAIANLYFAVLFARPVQESLQLDANVFAAAGYTLSRIAQLRGRSLGEAVA